MKRLSRRRFRGIEPPADHRQQRKSTGFQRSGEARRPRENFGHALPYEMNPPAWCFFVKIILGDDLLPFRIPGEAAGSD
jgi:hypothetical protein